MKSDPRLFSGPGVRVRQTPDGPIVRFPGKPVSWAHAWKVTLNGNASAAIAPGMVNGKTPEIDGVPLDDGTPPMLAWEQLDLDELNRGWIALEVSFDEKWSVLAATIVQVADLDTDDGHARPPGASSANAPAGYIGGGTLTLKGRRARHPLARLRLRDSGQLVRFQVAHFDLQHRAQVKSAGSTVARHFFSAVP